MTTPTGPPLPPWCALVRADNPGPMTLDGTNTYLLTGSAARVVVDPGPLLDAHVEAVAGPERVDAVLLTHHHLDHSEAAVRVHELTGAPVRAHDRALCVDAPPLADDERLDLGGVMLRVLHTPGHTADSVSFLVGDEDERERPVALLSGDTVLGRGTTVVSHPDGTLGPYLASLRRLRAEVRARDLLLPGHGPVRADPGSVIEQYLRHREERLAQVRAAVAAGARTPRDVVETVYADVDPSVWGAAESSVRAQLDYLDEQG